MRRIAAASAIGMVLAVSPLAATPAAAHNPTNCFHGHQTEGSWHAHFVDHFQGDDGFHYNIYDHFLFEGGFHNYQHTAVIQCGS